MLDLLLYLGFKIEIPRMSTSSPTLTNSPFDRPCDYSPRKRGYAIYDIIYPDNPIQLI